MPDRWQTYPIEFRGGLVTNLSPLQQGTNAPGTATVLRNFEPSVEGGYRRIKGFEKYDTNTVSNTGLIRGLTYFNDQVYAVRGDDIFRSSGSGWTQVTDTTAFPASTATADVDGAVSASTTLVVDNNSGTIKAGMVITGTGIVGTVTVASLSDQNNLVMSSTQTISDTVTLTFTEKSPTIGGSGKVRSLLFNFNGTDKVMFVDGVGKPFTFDGTTFKQLTSAPSDTAGANHVTKFKNHIFLAVGNTLIFSAPYDEEDFTAALGGGTIDLDAEITGLEVFREQLFAFTETSIYVVSGSTVADWLVRPVTQDIGCVARDTVQEIGGDVIFLSADGLRLLSATERNNDFGLGVISKPIQSELTELIIVNTSFTSIIIRPKSQYRLLGYNTDYSDDAARGVIMTQYSGQGGAEIAWAETRGINAYVSYSAYVGAVEYIFFANDDGYVYRLEQANTFDGENIPATFTTPYLPINDPEVRKTVYKAALYIDPDGSFDMDMTTLFDFNELGIVQPGTTEFNNTTQTVSFYGRSEYGTARYGGRLKFKFDANLTGSGFVVGFQFTSNSQDPPYSLDTLVLQYGTYGRR
jgi:hypothetical protein